MRFAEKVVIITGAGRGIGLACARRFAREGARVVIAEVDEIRGNEAVEDIESIGGNALFVHVDVGQKLHVHNMLAATLDTHGRVDILINNAAIAHDSSFLDLGEADFDRVLRTNLKAPFLATQAVGRQMIRQIADEPANQRESRDYAIVNISSIGAVAASPRELAYVVSKAALNQLTKATALALAPHGIRVNAVGPGSVSGEFFKPLATEPENREQIIRRTPLGRLGDPDEIASVAAFLASQDSSYITGQCIFADGGRLALDLNVAVKKARDKSKKSD